MLKRLSPLLLVLAAAIIGVWQFPNIRDWWILRNYQPPAEIVAFAQSTTMTPKATREFYLAQPDLERKQTFGQNCPVGELSLVLGCYNGSRIYVLKVEKAELSKVMDVTAAHEMLHAAYNSLGSSTKIQVNGWLQDYYMRHGLYDPKFNEQKIKYTALHENKNLLLPSDLFFSYSL